MKSKLDSSTLFHDCGYIYLSDIEPKPGDKIGIRLRAKKDCISRAFLVTVTNECDARETEMLSESEDETGRFVYYYCDFICPEQLFKYCFRVEDGDSSCYYGRKGTFSAAPSFHDSDRSWHAADQMWVILPGYEGPKWSRGITWYSLMPDSFYNGDLTNDEMVSGDNYSIPWNIPLLTTMYKYGGDLKGIEKKLDYIRSLGCEAIFFDPIFRSYQDAGYGPEYYRQIEHSHGNARALADLSKAVHEKNMRFMIDVVLTFVADNHYWFNKNGHMPKPGAAQEWDSPYHDYFYFDRDKDTGSYRSIWSGAKLNLANEKVIKEIYGDPDSFLQYYAGEPFSPDAIRFDCGGDLSGVRADGTSADEVDIMREVRPVLRSINSDLMLLSEYSLYHSMNKGVWDSRWNLQHVKFAFPYIRGEMTESSLADLLEREVGAIPRPMGLSSYNSMTDHDRVRIRNAEPAFRRAFSLIHFTGVGSPVLFYGDEIGIEREAGCFYSMNWNERNWDYRTLAETKALTELRKNQSCVRTGIVHQFLVDDRRHLIGFARIDDGSTTLTVSSRNTREVSCSIDTALIGIPEGTQFTDWFSGKTYMSGMDSMDVLLPPGGTVLVRGGMSSSFRDRYEICPKEDSFRVIETGTDSYLLECDDTETGVYLTADAFGEFSFGFNAEYQKEADPFVSIEGVTADDKLEISFSEGTLRIWQNGVADRSSECCSGDRIKLSRTWDNTVTLTVSDGFGRTVACESVKAELPSHVKIVFGCKNGTATFSGVTLDYSKEPVLSDDFRSGLSAMFDYRDKGTLSYGEEGLTVQAGEIPVEMLCEAPDEDWTIRTLIECAPRGKGGAGLIARQDDENCLTGCRGCVDGRNEIYISRTLSGAEEIIWTTADEYPDRPVTLQIQRIGSHFSLLMQYKDKDMVRVGESVDANFCRCLTGLTVCGSTEAEFGYVCFGNSINDGESYNTPYTPGFDMPSFGRMMETAAEPSLRITEGEFEYDCEGFLVKARPLAQMGICDKIFGDIKTDGTYSVESGEGFIGVELGKKAYDSPFGDGTAVVLTSDGHIEVRHGGLILKRIPAPDCEKTRDVRIVTRTRRGDLYVYSGTPGKLVFSIKGAVRDTGYVSYTAQNVIGRICNYYTASADAAFFSNSDFEKFAFAKDSAGKSWGHTLGFINPMGVGFTDFEARIHMKTSYFADSWQEPMTGLYICSPEGKFYGTKAIAVGFNESGVLIVKSGVWLEARITKLDPRDVTLKLRKTGKHLEVFANDIETPLIDTVLPTFNGGAITAFAYRTATVFDGFEIHDLGYSLWRE